MISNWETLTTFHNLLTNLHASDNNTLHGFSSKISVFFYFVIANDICEVFIVIYIKKRINK